MSARRYRARSVSDVQALLAANRGAKLLAGGQSLVPLLNLGLTAPPAIIDIGGVPELRGISREGDRIRIGALSTHADVAASIDVLKGAPALAEAAAVAGDAAARNRGTIGGNVVHADPASDLPPVLVALGAEMVVVGPARERTIAADQFFTGNMSSVLADDEILSAVTVPAARGGEGSAYEALRHPASRYAAVGVAAVVRVHGGSIVGPRVALGGLLPAARRMAGVERALTGQPADEAAVTLAAAMVSRDLGDDVIGDSVAPAEYRAGLAPVYITRAVLAAVARAGLA